MADYLGYMAFPGLEGIEEGTFALVHGARPGVGMIVARPQDFPPNHYGTLTIADNNGTAIQFPNCALDSGVIENSGGGQLIRYRILDRRWAWQYYRVSGAYNLYDDNLQVRSDTKKNPQELATLCLEMMREIGYDVSELPANLDLTVDWDFTNAAEALEDVCDRCGCRIVLGLDNRVRICRLGRGNALSLTDDVCSGGATIDPPEMPRQMEFVGGPDEFEWDFLLAPVAKELNGAIVDLSSASYTPAGGWSVVDLEGDFEQITGTGQRELAKQCAFRMYRIVFDNNTLEFPDLAALNDRNHVYLRNRKSLELLSYQLHTTTVNGLEVARPPVVYGIYHDGRDDAGNPNNTTTLVPLDQDSSTEYNKLAPVRIPWSLDPETQIVHFAEPVFQLEDNENGLVNSTASLRLRIAFRSREETTNGYDHWRHYINTGGPAPLTLTIRDEHIVRRCYPVFSPEGFAVSQTVDNSNEFRNEAQVLLEAKYNEMNQVEGMQLVFETIRPVSPDGAIQQVQWTVGGGTSKTMAWRNNDIQSVLPDYYQRRAKFKASNARNVVVGQGRTFKAPTVYS